MTLRQLIDDASTLALQLPNGLDTECKAWNMSREPIQTGDILRTTNLAVGADKDKTGLMAYFKIKP